MTYIANEVDGAYLSKQRYQNLCSLGEDSTVINKYPTGTDKDGAAQYIQSDTNSFEPYEALEVELCSFLKCEILPNVLEIFLYPPLDERVAWL